MNDFLIRILGGHSLQQSGRIVHIALQLGDGVPFIWLVLLGIILIPSTYLSYRRTADTISPTIRRILIGLRMTLFGLLLVFLARPVLQLISQSTVRRTVVFLVDGSKSMTIEDKRLDLADQKRAAIAMGTLDPRKGLDQPLANAASPLRDPSRLSLLKAELGGIVNSSDAAHRGLISELAPDFNFAGYGFADSLTALPLPEPTKAMAAGPAAGVEASALGQLDASGSATAIGDAIREVLRQKRGQPLAGIVLMTDGGNNAGSAPADAAQLAADQGAPIFSYGVGVTSPHDIAVTNVFVERYAFSNNQLPVAVRIRAAGMSGRTVPLILKLGDQTVVQKEVTFDRDGETVVDAHFVPQTPGNYQLTATIPPQEDEILKDNNTASQPLRIIDGKIKVLYIDTAPRWDFKYLQAMLLRDPRISPKFVLLEGDPGISSVEGSPYLPSVPRGRDDLFHYDLIIIGDIAPTALSIEQQQMLDEFVSKLGGAVIFLAGQNHNPAEYVNTALGKLLPIVPSPGGNVADLSRPIQLQLTSAGKASAMLAMSDDQAESARRWSTLPPLYWTAPVGKLKLGAEALVVNPNPTRSSTLGGMPVMASQPYGLGQVLFLGTDETWRWRQNELIPRHDALWSQIIQRLGLPHLLGLSQKVQLTSDKTRYSVGEHVTLYARVYGDNFEPLAAPSVAGSYAAQTGAPTSVALAAVPGQPGLFSGTFVVTSNGHYAFNLDNIASTKLEFDVDEPGLEMGDPAMNEALLRQLSASSGGAFFREENLAELPDAIRAKRTDVLTQVGVELGTSPLMFALIFGVACAEWFLRKRARLK